MHWLCVVVAGWITSDLTSATFARSENSYKGISDTIQKLVVDSVNQELDQILSNLTLAQMSGYYSDHYDKQEMYYI